MKCCIRTVPVRLACVSLAFLFGVFAKANAQTIYGYTGGAQYYTVPSGVGVIRVKAWGGGGGAAANISYPYGAGGGAGFVEADIPVSAGQVLTILVGQGGFGWNSQEGYGGSTYPNGGLAGNFSGGGGGRTEVTATGVLLIAGGGGGGGYFFSGGAGQGGAGGGSASIGGPPGTGDGGSSPNNQGGKVGTQSSGGAGGYGTCSPGTSGGSRYGGSAPGANTPGGSGGDGYFGGGGGGGGLTNFGDSGAGGGGGSSIISGAGLTNVIINAGSGSTPGNANDSDRGTSGASLMGNYGFGDGASTSCYRGGNGKVVITTVATPPQINNTSYSIGANQSQYVSYQISAIGGATSYAATSLPAGVSINTATGLISGNPTTTGTTQTTISVSNPYGSDSKTLTWNVAAAVISANPTVPSPIVQSSTMVISTNGYANFGIAWIQNNILRPDGSWVDLGNAAPNTSFTYTPDGGNGIYYFRCRVVDIYGNFNGSGDYFRFDVVPPPPPAVPTGLTGTATSSSTVALTWNASSGATTYYVYRGGSLIATPAGTAYSDSLLAANTTYQYSVASYTAASGPSAQCAAIPVLTAPSTPTGLSGTPNSSGSVSLTWSGSAGAAGYRIYRNGVSLNTAASTSFTDASTAANTSYSYTVAVYNSAGSSSAQSSAVSVLTAPAVPTGLSGAATSASTISLSWSAVTGATGYKIYRNGVQVNTTSATTYSEGGLVTGTTYNYSVASYNSAGTTSQQTGTVPVTPQNTPPPLAPTGLAAVAQSSSTVSLSWSASAGAAGYSIYRDGVKKGISSSTTFSDTGLLGSKLYNYTVAAYNSQGVEGSQSTPSVPVTTLAPDPSSDDDTDTIPNGIEAQLGFNVNDPAQIDSGNTVKLNVRRPTL